MTTNSMTLCRLSRREAEYLMMAPAVAGGWVDTTPDSREAVSTVCGDGPDFLAALPAQFSDYARRPVTPEQAAQILVCLDRAAKCSIVFDEKSAADSAARLRAMVEVAS